MSRFHQLSAGKIGSGPGMTPPIVSIAATRPPRAAIDMTVASRVRPRGRGIASKARKNRAAAIPAEYMGHYSGGLLGCRANPLTDLTRASQFRARRAGERV